MRYLALWLVLAAVYALSLGVDVFERSAYGGDEPHFLLAADSILADGDVDLTDELAAAAYADFYPYELEPHGHAHEGRLQAPHGIGFPLLITPAYALGGPLGVELFMAGLTALAFAVGLGVARTVTPEPWATRTVAVVALSPPVVAHSTSVLPDLTAGLLLALAVLLALRAREEPVLRRVAPSAACLAVLPWLGAEYALPALPVAALLLHWTLRRRARLAWLIAFELLSGSLIAYVAVNEVVYGGLVPSPAGIGGDVDLPWGLADRVPRLAGLWLDREAGLLRWAPVLALAFAGGWLLWRSRRDHIARALPERREAEAAAGLAGLVGAVVVLIAALGAPTLSGPWFAGLHALAAAPLSCTLVAWGARRLPRTAALLSALTLLGTAWLLVELRAAGRAGWAVPDSQAPLGPLVGLLPDYEAASAGSELVSAALLVGLLAVAGAEWLAWRGGRGRRAVLP